MSSRVLRTADQNAGSEVIRSMYAVVGPSGPTNACWIPETMGHPNNSAM